MFVAGLDIGSAFSRAVILDRGSIVAESSKPTGGDFSKAGEAVLSDAIQAAGLDQNEVRLIGACGLGASFITKSFSKIADLSCLSRGIHFLLPDVRSIIEVGNQYSRVVNINDLGKVTDSLASEKCAAGSGRILQIIANVLGVRVDELGPLSAQATRPAKFTSNCAVFLETEAISRVAEGIPVPDIVAGLHHTLSAKILGMAKRLKISDNCAMTGGGAMDSGLTRIIENALGLRLHVPEQFMLTSAIGAAMVATERVIDTVAAESCQASKMEKNIKNVRRVKI